MPSPSVSDDWTKTLLGNKIKSKIKPNKIILIFNPLSLSQHGSDFIYKKHGEHFIVSLKYR